MEEAKGSKGNRANKWISTNSDWKVAHEIAKGNKANHPKLSRLVELVELQLGIGTSKFIIFSEIRHTASLIVEKLSEINGALPVRFVGQGSREGDKGMTQMVLCHVILLL